MVIVMNVRVCILVLCPLARQMCSLTVFAAVLLYCTVRHPAVHCWHLRVLGCRAVCRATDNKRGKEKDGGAVDAVVVGVKKLPCSLVFLVLHVYVFRWHLRISV